MEPPNISVCYFNIIPSKGIFFTANINSILQYWEL